METITTLHYLVVAAALFVLGVIGVLTRRNVVIVLMSLNVEKREARIAIAHGKIRPLARWKFFNDKLLERSAQGRRQITVHPGRDQSH